MEVQLCLEAYNWRSFIAKLQAKQAVNSKPIRKFPALEVTATLGRQAKNLRMDASSLFSPLLCILAACREAFDSFKFECDPCFKQYGVTMKHQTDVDAEGGHRRNVIQITNKSRDSESYCPQGEGEDLAKRNKESSQACPHQEALIVRRDNLQSGGIV